ncbi:MAG: hypothetical protein SWH78_18095 [Thermodesulfobacteriota bacterium]|nr:hypothetical protein [Thermodesulfobacteriota bacterium]
MAHEDLKKQYEADALWHPRPWELWEWRHKDSEVWYPAVNPPFWYDNLIYRRRPDDQAPTV